MAFKVIKDWTTATGFRAVVIMTDMGHHCGYVGVPKEHPLHGAEYSNPCAALPKISEGEPVGKRSPLGLLKMAMDTNNWNSPESVFDVHGGVTYSGGSKDYPAISDGLWWFGYDCGHCYGSPSPEYQEKMREKYPDQPFMWSDRDGVFRDMDYCVAECESLASQISSKTTVPA